MGDLSAEPSMEEILSSIKRIIAEEGDGQPTRGPRRQPRPASAPPYPSSIGEEASDEVLELSDPMPAARPETEPRPPWPTPAPPPPAVVAPPEPIARQITAEPVVETIVSPGAAAASRGALDQLSRLMVKPEPGSDGSLEGLVREMLRPMLRDWLDANLPALVETMVQREIERITRTGA